MHEVAQVQIEATAVRRWGRCLAARHLDREAALGAQRTFDHRRVAGWAAWARPPSRAAGVTTMAAVTIAVGLGPRVRRPTCPPRAAVTAAPVASRGPAAPPRHRVLDQHQQRGIAGVDAHDDRAPAPPGARPRSQSYRASFFVAYANRIRERLAESNRAATDAATAEGGSAFLPVLADRRRDVDDLVDERFPEMVNSTVRSGWDPAGRVGGRMAADQAQLRFADLADADPPQPAQPTGALPTA